METNADQLTRPIRRRQTRSEPFGRLALPTKETSPITITLKPASDLTPAEIASCYTLVVQTGNRYPPGTLEQFHLNYNPTMVLAHQNDQLVGFQSYSFYEEFTPFKRKKMPFIYAGTVFIDARVAGRGVAYRMGSRYMRCVLGRFWALRDYAFLLGTHNPKLIQLMGAQHQLYLTANDTLTPALYQFVLSFVRQKRSNTHPINDQLVVCPPSTDCISNDITKQWSLHYQASGEPFNRLAFDLKLMEEIDDRRYQTGRFLLVLGRSSPSRLLKVSWMNCRKWLKGRFSLFNLLKHQLSN